MCVCVCVAALIRAVELLQQRVRAAERARDLAAEQLFSAYQSQDATRKDLQAAQVRYVRHTHARAHTHTHRYLEPPTSPAPTPGHVPAVQSSCELAGARTCP